MIIKLLGILDILCAGLLALFYFFSFVPTQLLMVAGIYLAVKGSFFLLSKDVASIIDIACAIVMFTIIAFNVPYFVVAICCLFLIQKGVFSLLV